MSKEKVKVATVRVRSETRENTVGVDHNRVELRETLSPP
jgi:hypothetical protein